MAGDADQIVIGAGGTIYVAPVGTAAPTDATTGLNAAFVDLGYVSQDGVTVNDTKTVVEIRAWQSPYPVRRLISDRAFEVSFVLEQFNDATVQLAFGGGTVSEPSDDKFKYVPPTDVTPDERAMVIAWSNGSDSYRLYIPRGLVIGSVTSTIKRNDGIMLPIQFAATTDGTSDPWDLFSNAALFESVAD